MVLECESLRLVFFFQVIFPLFIFAHAHLHWYVNKLELYAYPHFEISIDFHSRVCSKSDVRSAENEDQRDAVDYDPALNV